MSKVIKVIIERSPDGFDAYAQNVKGIYGHGDTVELAKESIREAIEIIKSFDDKNIPSALKEEYELSYEIDVESLLNYYNKIISFAALERLTGINQKQIQHYSTGYRKPRPVQRKKIEAALHQLGKELVQLEL